MQNLLKTIINSHSVALKSPMLVIGVSNYIRDHLPDEIKQQYDVHILFYPNNYHVWVLGLMLVHRTNHNQLPMMQYAIGQDAADTVKNLVTNAVINDEDIKEVHPKLILWWTHWVYRCAKVSFQDIIHLGSYKKAELEEIEYIEQNNEKVIGGVGTWDFFKKAV